MNADGSQKKENLRRALFTTAEIRLDARMKRLMADIKGQDGHPPSRAWGRVLYDEAKPVGMLGRRLVDLKIANAPLESGERLIDELRDWLVNDLYKRYRPAPAKHVVVRRGA